MVVDKRDILLLTKTLTLMPLAIMGVGFAISFFVPKEWFPLIFIGFGELVIVVFLMCGGIATKDLGRKLRMFIYVMVIFVLATIIEIQILDKIPSDEIEEEKPYKISSPMHEETFEQGKPGEHL